MRIARLIGENRQIVGRKTRKVISHGSQPSREFQHVTCVVGGLHGIHQAMALIDNAKQAMSEGKSGPVETGLTGHGLTATAL